MQELETYTIIELKAIAFDLNNSLQQTHYMLDLVIKRLNELNTPKEDGKEE